MTFRNTAQKMMPETASFSSEDILTFLIANGNINLCDVEQQMENARLESILKEHPYKIYQGKDGRWRTQVRDDSKPYRRRIIVKKS